MTRVLQAKPASRVSVARTHGHLLQRRCACGGNSGASGECETCGKKQVQRRATEGAVPSFVPTIVREVLQSTGEPLDVETRRAMEPRLGHDFRNVRIHTGARAAESASAVNALAYTVGRDVVFGAGQFAPKTEAGSKLMAHELAHVIQQDGRSFQSTDTLRIGPQHDAFEEQAEMLAAHVDAATPIHSSDAGVVQRVESGTGDKTPDVDYCSGWLQDPQSLSKRAAEVFVRTEMPGDHGNVEKIDCNPSYKLPDLNCIVTFSDGTTVKVMVNKNTIIVGATVNQQMIYPRCWYDFSCTEKNRDLVLTKRKCESGSSSGKSERKGPNP